MANRSATAHSDKSFTTHSDTGVLLQLRGALLCVARLNLTFLSPCPPTVTSRQKSGFGTQRPVRTTSRMSAVAGKAQIFDTAESLQNP